MPSGHGNGLRPRIRTSGRRNAHEPVNLILDFEHAHVSSHSIEQRVSSIRAIAPAVDRLGKTLPRHTKSPAAWLVIPASGYHHAWQVRKPLLDLNQQFQSVRIGG